MQYSYNLSTLSTHINALTDTLNRTSNELTFTHYSSANCTGKPVLQYLLPIAHVERGECRTHVDVNGGTPWTFRGLYNNNQLQVLEFLPKQKPPADTTLECEWVDKPAAWQKKQDPFVKWQ